MKIEWVIEQDDIDKVKQFLARYIETPFVQFRIKNNITNKTPDLSIENIWFWSVACLLSSQQRSGPDSKVSKLIRTEPFPLSYDRCVKSKDVAGFVTATLVDFGGIRFVNKLGRFLSTNLSRLETGLWGETKAIFEELAGSRQKDHERKAAEFIRINFLGFGPKQSRNLLQSLGISRYEIPIDSRITKWLNRYGFPMHLRSNALQDIHYYNLVSDGFQALCEGVGVYPCVLDAAIFVSFDTKS